jgi:hypothetical protein
MPFVKILFLTHTDLFLIAETDALLPHHAFRISGHKEPPAKFCWFSLPALYLRGIAAFFPPPGLMTDHPSFVI